MMINFFLRTTCKWLTIPALAVCIYALSCQALAQSRITLNLDNAPVLDLVRWAQDVTPKTIIVHPNVQGKVTVVAGDPMTREEAYQVFLSVLDVHGYAVVNYPTALKVLPNTNANQSRLPLKTDDEQLPAEEIVIKILKIKNVAASKLLGILKPLAGKDAYLAAYSPTNSIIIADRAGNIEELNKLVYEVDQTGAVDIKMVPLQYANAAEVISILNSLLPQQGTDSLTLKLAVDERSNSILMSGDLAAKQQILGLINQLDTPLPGEGNTQVIYLNYADANEVMGILQSISGSALKNNKDQSISDSEVTIQASTTLNALIITAPSSLLTTMKDVIEKLDMRRSQVLVEALIVEVNEDLNDSFGVQWEVGPYGVHEQAVSGFSSFPSNLSPLSVSDGELTLGTGFSLGYLRGGDLKAVITALKGQADANVLSTPTIMALDNEEAHILVGENVPFVTGSEKGIGNDEPFQTIERKDIGITLRVVPRINNDNSVTLKIDQSVESIGQTDVETADIITNKREINTRVLIGNGETLVLGGLVRDEIQESESRVPVLSNIPFIGHAFRSRSSSLVKRNLMVFIRPQIITDDPAGREISFERYEHMREQQNRFSDQRSNVFAPKTFPELPELTLPDNTKLQNSNPPPPINQ